MSSINEGATPANWPTDAEKELLRESFLRLIPRSEEASQSFYSRLFAEHPSVEPLFPADMESQQDKLVLTLATMVDHLDAPETFAKECQALGSRHGRYGAQREHYPVVGQLLLEEFGRRQVPAMTQQEVGLWQRLYQLVSEQMIAGQFPTG